MIEFINFYIIRVLANRNANLNKFITIRYKSIYFLNQLIVIFFWFTIYSQSFNIC